MAVDNTANHDPMHRIAEFLHDKEVQAVLALVAILATVAAAVAVEHAMDTPDAPPAVVDNNDRQGDQ